MSNNICCRFRGSMLVVLVGAVCAAGAWPLHAVCAEAALEQRPAESIVVSRSELFDRLYGGWVGMLIGGLEGLPHEFKYNDTPRETLPPGVHLPPPSSRPLVLALGTTVISFGIVLRGLAIPITDEISIPIILVLGLLIFAWGLFGWIRDDYRAADKH